MIRGLIVVVDDDISICHLIKKYLEKENFRIIIAENREEALSIIEK